MRNLPYPVAHIEISPLSLYGRGAGGEGNSHPSPPGPLSHKGRGGVISHPSPPGPLSHKGRGGVTATPHPPAPLP